MQIRHPHESLLHLKAKYNDINSVKQCIKVLRECKDISKPNISAKNRKGNTALLIALFAAKFDVAKLLIQEGVDPNLKNTNGGYALNMAARNGWLEIMHYLIFFQADLTLTNGEGSTVLMAAAYFGHPDIVQLLINAGVNLDITNKKSLSALDYSITNTTHTRHLLVMRALLEAGICINDLKQLNALFNFLQKKHMEQNLEQNEDIYVCLSLLYQQQEKLRKEKPEKFPPDQKIYQNIENLLLSLHEPVYFQKRREKIETVTKQIFPTHFPKDIDQIIAKYDHPICHRLFAGSKKQKTDDSQIKTVQKKIHI